MVPVLETERLRLRPRGLADLEDCFAMDREPGTLQFIAWPDTAGGWGDEAAHRAFIGSRIEARYPEGLGYWVIERREAPGEFLGWVLLIPIDDADVEIGWRVPGAARGRGYATEAAARVLAHGLELGLTRIVADIRSGNGASVAVARKIGMREHGPAPGAADALRYVAP